MRQRQRPDWDVSGLSTLRSGLDAGQITVRIRCYPDGHSIVDHNGVAFHVPASMSATEFFGVCFRDMFGLEERARASGD